MTETFALTYQELAAYLKFDPETIKKIWRQYPHYFAGSGRTLKSARFDLQDVISHLKGRDYANIQVQNETGHPIPSGVQASGSPSEQGWVSSNTRGKGLDKRRKAETKPVNGDKWGLFRFGK